jgi:hypothetical protein
MINNSTNINKTNSNLSPLVTNHKQTIRNCVGNLGPHLNIIFVIISWLILKYNHFSSEWTVDRAKQVNVKVSNDFEILIIVLK